MRHAFFAIVILATLFGCASRPSQIAMSARPISVPNGPLYPLLEVEKGNRGIVLTRFIVPSDGTVRNVDVISSSGTPALDAAAVSMILAMRWAPAKNAAGQPIGSTVEFPISFGLDESTDATPSTQSAAKLINTMGIRAQESSVDIPKLMDSPTTKMLLIGAVVTDSPADLGGIEIGDVILTISGSRISSLTDVSLATSDIPKRRRVGIPMKIWRRGTVFDCIVHFNNGGSDPANAHKCLPSDPSNRSRANSAHHSEAQPGSQQDAAR